MSAYTPDELLPKYSREEISAEQAVGYILQNLVQMQKSIEEMRKEIERLKAFVGMEKNAE